MSAHPAQLSEKQEALIKEWAEDSRLWENAETTEFNLRTFARSIVAPLITAILEHHDQKADDRCWLDDHKLYSAAGLEPADTGISDPDAMLGNCARFIACRMTKGKWPTYQQLEARIEELKDVNTVLKIAIGDFLVHHAPVLSGTTEDQLRAALAKA